MYTTVPEIHLLHDTPPSEQAIRDGLPLSNSPRWWTRLATSSAVDVWLLSWLPGQTTALHDHGRSSAAFAVVQGELEEDRATADHRRIRHLRGSGSITLVPAGERHDVTGGGTTPAVSIHAYSPPLTEMNYYDDRGTLVRSVRTHEPEEELKR